MPGNNTPKGPGVDKGDDLNEGTIDTNTITLDVFISQVKSDIQAATADTDSLLLTQKLKEYLETVDTQGGLKELASHLERISDFAHAYPYNAPFFFRAGVDITNRMLKISIKLQKEEQERWKQDILK